MIKYRIRDYPKWYLNDNVHREDGPAIECAEGYKEWWLNGKAYTEQEFIQITQGKELSVAEIEQLLGYKIKVVKMIEYTVRVYEDRTKWLLNGKLHREDGPALEHADGTKFWFLNGKRHRIDGPAVEYTSGKKAWYLNGKQYSEQEFNQLIQGKELSVAEIEQLLGYKIKVVK
jgi:hypothetical protein